MKLKRLEDARDQIRNHSQSQLRACTVISTLSLTCRGLCFLKYGLIFFLVCFGPSPGFLQIFLLALFSGITPRGLGESIVWDAKE